MNKYNMDKIVNDFSIGLFIWQALIVLSIGLWIYCLIDILKNKFAQNDKIIWVLVVILIPFVGSLLYLFIGRNKKLKLD
ncbi:PLD nuclease N-terminal domain-containing protein [Aestuariibaculum sp. YM273]|uniref:PLD nuclease N-terminal domain-containing protein n=1 Tax=Aestuariibaculum sp. YM273 TaxID=3070659 RepID=UPI0027DBC0A3|nr:PLD nuclease N-terminal domain-containing protein [Aestuariibaculum sp. YM273]WMI65455.1 PLD nuclease N-terminal domain-containing protein [Aestuariibaculum sp. YM273]